MRRVRFLGVGFTPLSLEAAAGAIVARHPAEPFAYVVTPNAQHVVAAQADFRFAWPQADAWLVVNDSRILRLLARRLFGLDLPLCAGSDLVARLFQTRRISDIASVTLIGGDEVVERWLRETYGLVRLVRYDPPMGFADDPAEVDRCLDFLRANPARYTFFAVGAPQSEMLAWRLAREGGATGIGLCIGSALNFLTGRVRRAPRWVQAASLEWAWRLAQRPVGHFRRVFVESAPVLWLALKARAGRLA